MNSAANIPLRRLCSVSPPIKRFSAATPRQSDIAVGFPVSNRNRIEFEGSIGFFINTLVSRTDFSDDPSIDVLLNRIRQSTLEAHAHRDIPFEKLVENLHLSRDRSRSPLFQALFAYQESLPRSFDLPGLDCERIAIDNPTSKFDITLFITPQDDIFTGQIEFNTGLFERATIQRFISYWKTLVSSMLDDPELRVSELPLLDAWESGAELQRWNVTFRDRPAGELLHERFEWQCGQDPNRIALTFEGRSITYGELNQRANRLAHYLLRLGIQPDQPVGVCAERSIELTVSLFAVLKARRRHRASRSRLPHRSSFLYDGGCRNIIIIGARASFHSSPIYTNEDSSY